MPSRSRSIAAFVMTTALALPAGAAAQTPTPTPPPTPAPTPEQCKAQNAKSKRLPLFTFKGVYQGRSAIRITKVNALARRAGFLRKRVTFDASCATVRSGDGDGNPYGSSIDDLRKGDIVTFEARLPRRTKYRLGVVYKATRATNHTNKPSKTPAVPPAPAPAPAPPAL